MAAKNTLRKAARQKVKETKQGDSGSNVKLLQEALNDTIKPKPKLKTDGKFSAKTAEALQAFQKKYRVRGSGKADLATWTAMSKMGGKAAKAAQAMGIIIED